MEHFLLVGVLRELVMENFWVCMMLQLTLKENLFTQLSLKTIEFKNSILKGPSSQNGDLMAQGDRDFMRAPHQIAVNSLSKVFLTDSNGNQILKFYDNGTFIGTLGSKGVGPGQFNTPHGIAIDANDNIYVTDMKNYRVQVFDSKDTFVRQWGSLGTGSGQFSETVPGIAIDTNYRVYVVDKINSRVQMFDNAGNYLSSWGSDGKGPQQLHKPEDIAVNNQGEVIYITDTRNSRVQILQVT